MGRITGKIGKFSTRKKEAKEGFYVRPSWATKPKGNKMIIPAEIVMRNMGQIEKGPTAKAKHSPKVAPVPPVARESSGSLMQALTAEQASGKRRKNPPVSSLARAIRNAYKNAARGQQEAEILRRIKDAVPEPSTKEIGRALFASGIAASRAEKVAMEWDSIATIRSRQYPLRGQAQGERQIVELMRKLQANTERDKSGGLRLENFFANQRLAAELVPEGWNKTCRAISMVTEAQKAGAKVNEAEYYRLMNDPQTLSFHRVKLELSAANPEGNPLVSGAGIPGEEHEPKGMDWEAVIGLLADMLPQDFSKEKREAVKEGVLRQFRTRQAITEAFNQAPKRERYAVILSIFRNLSPLPTLEEAELMLAGIPERDRMILAEHYVSAFELTVPNRPERERKAHATGYIESFTRKTPAEQVTAVREAEAKERGEEAPKLTPEGEPDLPQTVEEWPSYLKRVFDTAPADKIGEAVATAIDRLNPGGDAMNPFADNGRVIRDAYEALPKAWHQPIFSAYTNLIRTKQSEERKADIERRKSQTNESNAKILEALRNAPPGGIGDAIIEAAGIVGKPQPKAEALKAFDPVEWVNQWYANHPPYGKELSLEKCIEDQQGVASASAVRLAYPYDLRLTPVKRLIRDAHRIESERDLVSVAWEAITRIKPFPKVEEVCDILHETDWVPKLKIMDKYLAVSWPQRFGGSGESDLMTATTNVPAPSEAINPQLLETLHKAHVSIQLAIEGACTLLEGHLHGRIDYALALQLSSGHLLKAVADVLKAGGYLVGEGE